MAPPAFLLPAPELLDRESDRDQEELEEEPVGPEPEEQVDAEDDRDRPEASVQASRRVQDSSRSNAQANRSCAASRCAASYTSRQYQPQ